MSGAILSSYAMAQAMIAGALKSPMSDWTIQTNIKIAYVRNV